jgi:prepilin-type N-terminal cleavage/methylation domain-containing protein
MIKESKKRAMKTAAMHGGAAMGVRGFTLLEMILVMGIMGIMAAAAGLGMFKMSSSFLMARNNAEFLSKAQVAMTRTEKELYMITKINSGSALSINFNTFKNGATSTHTIGYDPATKALSYDGSVLVDGISAFSFAYCNLYTDDPAAAGAATASASTKIIQYSITLTANDGTPYAFTNRIAPRNL